MTWLSTAMSAPRANGHKLTALYDAAATGWQDGIHRLGFGQAYASLIEAAFDQGASLGRVIDVGTGTGALAHALLDRTAPPAALTLMDMSAAMLTKAAERLPATRLIEASLGAQLGDLPPQDVVLCAHVIEHCPDGAQAVAALFDMTAPGGRLVLAVSKPHWCTALVRWRWGNAAFQPEDVCTMLRAAGFDDIAVHRFQAGPPSRVSCGYIARRPD